MFKKKSLACFSLEESNNHQVKPELLISSVSVSPAQELMDFCYEALRPK